MTLCLMMLSLSAMSQVYSKDLEKRAKAGDAQAQYEVGLCYFYGYNVACNISKGEKWLKSAAKQGFSKASYELGRAMRNGDLKGNASEWFLKAAADGDDVMKMNVVDQLVQFRTTVDAKSILSAMAATGDYNRKMLVVDKLIEIGEKKEALTILESIAETGDIHTQTQIADKYINMGLESEAVYWYQKSAKSGNNREKLEIAEKLVEMKKNSEAMGMLDEVKSEDAATDMKIAEIYEKICVTLGDSYRNYVDKFRRRAAEKGDPEAQFLTGKSLIEKKAVKDGVAWLMKSAAQGYEPAKLYLGQYKADQERLSAMAEGRALPTFDFITENSWNLYSHGKWNAKAIDRFSAVCQGDLKTAMGLPDMDELDLMRYKQSDQYQQDLDTLNKRKDELYAYIVDLEEEDFYRTHPVIFTTNSLTIPDNIGRIALPNSEKIHVRIWKGPIMIPVKDGVVKEMNGSHSYTFKCDDINTLYDIKALDRDLALVFLFKPAYAKAMNRTNYNVINNKVESEAMKIQYNFANTIGIYLMRKSTGTVVLDLNQYKRDITSPAEMQRNTVAFNADQRVANQTDAASKPKYHSNPKRILCFFCGGNGYTREGNACIFCSRRGYTLEHYY